MYCEKFNLRGNVVMSWLHNETFQKNENVKEYKNANEKAVLKLLMYEKPTYK